jgi:hypothetical protein
MQLLFLTLLLLIVTAFIALQGDQLEAKRYAARQACRFLHGLMQGERYCDDSNYTALRGQGDAELYRDDGHHAYPASKYLLLLILLLLLLLSVLDDTCTIRMSMVYVYTQHARHCNHNKLNALYSAATHSCPCASLSCVLVDLCDSTVITSSSSPHTSSACCSRGAIDAAK